MLPGLVVVLVRVFLRNGTNRRYTHTQRGRMREREREICFKELVHVIVEVGKSEICEMG